MNILRRKGLLAASLFSVALVGAAHAGGFSRGSADTDILFEDGNFNMRTSVTYVSPSRKFSSNVGNPYLVGVDYAQSYVIPSAAVKFKIAEDLSCAGTLTQTYGADAKYPLSSGTSGKTAENFTMYEYGATCGYKVDLSKGRIWFIGGLYDEVTRYNLTAGAALGTADPTLLVHLKDDNLGWRAGVAYEIPEVALRAQLMYRSGVDIDASGDASYMGSPLPHGATGDASFPQSVEMKLQSGIAPGWLAYGSVKWTDWSVTENLNLHVPDLGPAGEKANLYHWKDGWTVVAGVGHKFNDWLSGTIFVGYDSGVSSGYDLTAESYSLGGGVSMKDKWGGELRLGGAVSRLGSASETKYSMAACGTPGDPTCGWNRSVEAGWAYALSAGYALKW